MIVKFTLYFLQIRALRKNRMITLSFWTCHRMPKTFTDAHTYIFQSKPARYLNFHLKCLPVCMLLFTIDNLFSIWSTCYFVCVPLNIHKNKLDILFPKWRAYQFACFSFLARCNRFVICPEQTFHQKYNDCWQKYVLWETEKILLIRILCYNWYFILSDISVFHKFRA